MSKWPDERRLQELNAEAQFSNLDFYVVVAAEALGIPRHEVTREMRMAAKERLFAYTYGYRGTWAGHARDKGINR